MANHFTADEALADFGELVAYARFIALQANPIAVLSESPAWKALDFLRDPARAEELAAVSALLVDAVDETIFYVIRALEIARENADKGASGLDSGEEANTTDGPMDCASRFGWNGIELRVGGVDILKSDLQPIHVDLVEWLRRSMNRPMRRDYSPSIRPFIEPNSASDFLRGRPKRS